MGLQKRVRTPRFESRSALPASAACVVANGVRETLTSLLGAPVAMRLFEPTIPVPSAWQAILRDAILYRVRGSVADAAMILRPPDACALARAVFAEPPSASAELQPLSPIERDVVDRTATAIASNLGALCGVRNGHAERVGTIGGFVSFFELLLEKPIDARIGIAISRDPSPERRGALDLAQLAEVRFAAVASLDLGNVSADAVACLAPGAILAIHSSELRRCTLKTSGRRLARGSCGVRNGRYAITTEAIFEI